MKNMAARKPLGSLAVLYISGFVGAGYSSGQEVFQFFASHGKNGLVPIILFPLLLTVLSLIFLWTARRKHSVRYEEIISPVASPLVKAGIDIVISVFIVIAVVSSVAAIGSILQRLTGLPSFVGNLLAVGLAAGLLLLGSIQKAASMLKPFLLLFLVCVCLICVYTLATVKPAVPAFAPTGGSPISLSGGPLFWLALYISYNLLVIIGVLSPVSRDIPMGKSLAVLGTLCPLLISATIALQYFALIRLFPEGNAAEMPLIYAASLISPVFSGVYQVLMLAAAVCTVVSCFNSTIDRVGRITLLQRLPRSALIATTAFLLFLCSLIGFSNVIRYVYPTIGFLGFFVLALLIISYIKLRIYKKHAVTGQKEASHETA